MFSVYDLAFTYIEKNFTDIGEVEKRMIVKSISNALRRGVLADQLMELIKNTPSKDFASLFSNVNKNNNSVNVLSQDKFYYHNELRITSEAPKRIWDVDTGEIKIIEQEFFMEMKASYSAEDVLKYISKKEFLFKTLIDWNRAFGSVNFLLKKYDIDFLLFLIDTAADIYSGRQRYAKSLIEISEYESEAKCNYEKRITEAKINGDCSITPKKRELFKGR